MVYVGLKMNPCPEAISKYAFFTQKKELYAKKEPDYALSGSYFLVGEGGFEPPKSVTTDLQSAPFGRSGTLPYSILRLKKEAGGRTRTPDLLITNQLLYQLSYTSISQRSNIIPKKTIYVK